MAFEPSSPINSPASSQFEGQTSEVSLSPEQQSKLTAFADNIQTLERSTSELCPNGLPFSSFVGWRTLTNLTRDNYNGELSHAERTQLCEELTGITNTMLQTLSSNLSDFDKLEMLITALPRSADSIEEAKASCIRANEKAKSFIGTVTTPSQPIKKNTPIQLAIIHHKNELVTALIQDIQNSDLFEGDANGKSPLNNAHISTNLTAIELLKQPYASMVQTTSDSAESSVDESTTSFAKLRVDGTSPLHQAAKLGNIEALKEMITSSLSAWHGEMSDWEEITNDGVVAGWSLHEHGEGEGAWEVIVTTEESCSTSESSITSSGSSITSSGSSSATTESSSTSAESSSTSAESSNSQVNASAIKTSDAAIAEPNDSEKQKKETINSARNDIEALEAQKQSKIESHSAVWNIQDIHGNSPAMVAVNHGQNDFVKMLIEEKDIKLNVVNYSNENILHQAVLAKPPKTLAYLLTLTDSTPSMHRTTLKNLLTQKSKSDKTPLEEACRHGSLEAIKMLHKFNSMSVANDSIKSELQTQASQRDNTDKEKTKILKYIRNKVK
ncbi:ankyrin repeat domain-containing protein [Parashewanella spongiae]|uniref:Ankyrin repeat domain-containing protein n=1 Tax=Parashewanella spongiae TaxID=342950 RepID=A0A3A6T6X7_9GAMM|nr:ankyrin repeat domain-containing protein [Parashewanella spongiae]MCL1078373.1 ankyrin repeat domain-containing protein [Parashewanella spongiae]RJY07092.1 ankyrin repeat domain-containing protein [Parashewanella spongiae]